MLSYKHQKVIDYMIGGQEFSAACISAGYSKSYSNSQAYPRIKNKPEFAKALEDAKARHRVDSMSEIDKIRKRLEKGLDACQNESGEVVKGLLAPYFAGCNLLGKTHAAFIEKNISVQEELEREEMTEKETAEANRIATIRLRDVS